MELYKRALILLHRLMQEIGSEYWADYIKIDLHEWDLNSSVKHHLNAYHKEGLTDMWICVGNGHNIDEILEPWANEIRDNICKITVETAKRINDTIESNVELKRIYESKEELLKDRSFQKQLIASLCQKCQYTVFHPKRIEWVVANRLAPKIVFDYFTTKSEEKLLDFKGIYESKHVRKFRNDIINTIKSYNYEIAAVDEHMKKCDVCGYEKTAAKYFYVDHGTNFTRIVPR